METAKLNQPLYDKNVLTTGDRRRPEYEVCRAYEFLDMGAGNQTLVICKLVSCLNCYVSSPYFL